jgi:hypothetical protein
MTTRPEPPNADEPLGAVASSEAQPSNEPVGEQPTEPKTNSDPAAVPDPSVQDPDLVRSDQPD